MFGVDFIPYLKALYHGVWQAFPYRLWSPLHRLHVLKKIIYGHWSKEQQTAEYTALWHMLSDTKTS